MEPITKPKIWDIPLKWVKTNWLLILVIILGLITLKGCFKSMETDKGLKDLKKELKEKEKERQDIVNERKPFIDLITSNNKLIQKNEVRDSLLILNFGKLTNTQNIKTLTNDKIKTITYYTSADLLQYYRNLPDSLR